VPRHNPRREFRECRWSLLSFADTCFHTVLNALCSAMSAYTVTGLPSRRPLTGDLPSTSASQILRRLPICGASPSADTAAPPNLRRLSICTAAPLHLQILRRLSIDTPTSAAPLRALFSSQGEFAVARPHFLKPEHLSQKHAPPGGPPSLHRPSETPSLRPATAGGQPSG
jgi:hypothetical protein